MRYELINPSDKIYYEAPDAIHSAIATILLSVSYGGECLDDSEQSSPIFLFGGAEKWVKEKSGKTMQEYLRANAQSIRDTLLSFRYEGERTSMSRIVDIAHQYADAINRNFLQEKEVNNG